MEYYVRTMNIKERFCNFWKLPQTARDDFRGGLIIAFFVVFLFYLLEIVREIVDEWEVVVGTRGQWVVILFTLFLAVWVTNPWGWCKNNIRDHMNGTLQEIKTEEYKD